MTADSPRRRHPDTLQRGRHATSPTSGYSSISLPTGTVTFLLTDVEGSTRLWEAYSKRSLATIR